MSRFLWDWHIYWLWHVRSVDISARVHAHAKRISMSQTVGQLLVLRRRASENHKLGRSEVTEGGLKAARGNGGLERRRPRSACRMHLHLKWLRQILRCEITWCVISIVSFLSFLFSSDRRRSDITPGNIRFLAFIGIQDFSPTPWIVDLDFYPSRISRDADLWGISRFRL